MGDALWCMFVIAMMAIAFLWLERELRRGR